MTGRSAGENDRPVHPDHARLIRMLTLKGAVASVALSHPEGCICTTCRAAHGDKLAFAQIVEVVGLGDEEDDEQLPPPPPYAA